jgi:Na+/alanine symporter
MDINLIIKRVGDFAWGPITIVFLVGAGVYLTLRTGFIQIRGLTLHGHSSQAITIGQRMKEK